jgi:hypothetical protein
VDEDIFLMRTWCPKADVHVCVSAAAKMKMEWTPRPRSCALAYQVGSSLIMHADPEAD